MRWDQVLTLLHIAEVTNNYPKLHSLRNKALDALEATDLEALHFEGYVEEEE